MTTLALIISGSVGSLLLWLVGLCIALAIVVFILKQLEAPPLAYKVLYVIIGVIALLLVIDLFFHNSGGTVIVR